MITIEGARHRLCNGVTRRDVLRIGSLGIAGFAVMNGAAYWAIKDLRWSLRTTNRHATQLEGNSE